MSSPNHTTKIRRKSIKNVGVGRLIGHRNHLVLTLSNGPAFEGSRMDWAQLAGKVWLIENELDRRGVTYTRRTLTDRATHTRTRRR